MNTTKWFKDVVAELSKDKYKDVEIVDRKGGSIEYPSILLKSRSAYFRAALDFPGSDNTIITDFPLKIAKIAIDHICYGTGIKLSDMSIKEIHVLHEFADCYSFPDIIIKIHKYLKYDLDIKLIDEVLSMNFGKKINSICTIKKYNPKYKPQRKI